VRQLYQKTGAPLHAAYALAQLRVFYREQQQQQSATDAVVHQWQTIASACLSRWTGCPTSSLPMSYSEASWTGLLHVGTCDYEPTALELLPPECRAALPALADYNGSGSHETVAALLRNGIPEYCNDSNNNNNNTQVNPYWTKWPALRGARLFLGLGDGACANLGSKCSVAARIACTVGTSAAARVCLPWPKKSGGDHDAIPVVQVPPGLFCYRIDQNHVLVGGALTDGGSVVEWASTLLNLPTASEAFRECLGEVERRLQDDYAAASTASSRTAMTVVPFLSGERSTGFRGGATMSMHGLTRDTTPAVFLKGCLEGVTLRVNAIVQLIQQAIHSSSNSRSTGSEEEEEDDDDDDEEEVRIICSGNALEKNALWRQLIADCSGLKVVLDQETREGTSRGVVKLIQQELSKQQVDGQTHDYETEVIDASITAVPREQARDYWTNARNSQESLIEAVSPLY